MASNTFGVQVFNQFGDIDLEEDIDGPSNSEEELHVTKKAQKKAAAKARMSESDDGANQAVLKPFGKVSGVAVRSNGVAAPGGEVVKPDRRNNDRKSGSNKTGIKPQEKRNGAGSYNWGKPEEDGNWANGEEAPPADGEQRDAEKENAGAPEEPMMSYEEYQKELEMKRVKPVYAKTRKANEGEQLKCKKLNPVNASEQMKQKPKPVYDVPSEVQRKILEENELAAQLGRHGGPPRGRGGRGRPYTPRGDRNFDQRPRYDRPPRVDRPAYNAEPAEVPEAVPEPAVQPPAPAPAAAVTDSDDWAADVVIPKAAPVERPPFEEGQPRGRGGFGGRGGGRGGEFRGRGRGGRGAGRGGRGEFHGGDFRGGRGGDFRGGRGGAHRSAAESKQFNLANDRDFPSLG